MLTPAMASEFGIELKPGSVVDRVDVGNRTVGVQGENLSFDKLVFASGGRARERAGALKLSLMR